MLEILIASHIENMLSKPVVMKFHCEERLSPNLIEEYRKRLAILINLKNFSKELNVHFRKHFFPTFL